MTAVPTDINDFADEDPTVVPDDWEFTTIVEESPTGVVFDEIGDRFIGCFEGVEKIVPENGEDPFDLLIFRGRNKVRYSVNNSYKLARAMDGIPKGAWVLLTYVQDIPTKKGNPMKDFRVEIKRS